MGASILVHWPGATDDDEQGHPGFFNDDQAWATWLTEVVGDPDANALLHRLGVSALLSHTTEGMSSSAIVWTTPDDLERAANGLRMKVDANDPEVRPLVDLYERNAIRADPPEIEFSRDLGDVAQIAQYARGAGASTVTLGYYW